MRKEPYTVGSIVHVVKRGARGMYITRDKSDQWRFPKLLYYFNDSNRPDEHWERDVEDIQKGLHFNRPSHWKERKQLVNILSDCLMPNHFHLLLEEIEDGGISKFMQGLCGSMSVYHNNKYKEKGSLFQGAYKSKTVDSDYYLDLLYVYINVKNPFELYEGGLENAIKNFDDAYREALEYDFCSLADVAGKRNSPIISKHELFDYTPAQFKRISKDFLSVKLEKIHDSRLE